MDVLYRSSCLGLIKGGLTKGLGYQVLGFRSQYAEAIRV
jgi:hypothetical protein